jgi:hypothetical protein
MMQLLLRDVSSVTERGIQAGMKRSVEKPKGYPVTPDGRYFVVRGRLWRCTNPVLAEEERTRLVGELMKARSAKGRAMRAGDSAAREEARQAVDAAKIALGERGPVWWKDDAVDWNRKMVKGSPYAEWFEKVISDKL